MINTCLGRLTELVEDSLTTTWNDMLCKASATPRKANISSRSAGICRGANFSKPEAVVVTMKVYWDAE